MKFDHLKKLVDMMFVPDGSGGVKQRYDGVDVNQLNPLVLAYIGDAYFHLFVRGRILSYEQCKVQVLHQFSAQIVSAVWQARAYQGIEEQSHDTSAYTHILDGEWFVILSDAQENIVDATAEVVYTCCKTHDSHDF